MAKAFNDLRMTVAQFCKWPGDGTDTRFELVRGRVVAMAPPSGRHVDLAHNISRILQAGLRAPCRALQGGGVARDLEDDECRIPDVFVTCEATPEHLFSAPRLVVEVLSPSTEKDDRTAKLDFYKSLPSVTAILLVWQDKRRAQLHTREAVRWPAQDFTGGSIVPLTDLGIELVLDEVYAGVEAGERHRDPTGD